MPGLGGEGDEFGGVGCRGARKVGEEAGEESEGGGGLTGSHGVGDCAFDEGVGVVVAELVADRGWVGFSGGGLWMEVEVERARLGKEGRCRERRTCLHFEDLGMRRKERVSSGAGLRRIRERREIYCRDAAGEEN